MNYGSGCAAWCDVPAAAFGCHAWSPFNEHSGEFTHTHLKRWRCFVHQWCIWTSHLGRGIFGRGMFTQSAYLHTIFQFYFINGGEMDQREMHSRWYRLLRRGRKVFGSQQVVKWMLGRGGEGGGRQEEEIEKDDRAPVPSLTGECSRTVFLICRELSMVLFVIDHSQGPRFFPAPAGVPNMLPLIFSVLSH